MPSLPAAPSATARALFAVALGLATSGLAGAAAPSDSDAATPTFHRDVEPLLQRHCQDCHRPAGSNYGGMRAQIVTPLFREDSLAAVLSIHCLTGTRDWTRAEIALARSAARLMGLLIGATLA